MRALLQRKQEILRLLALEEGGGGDANNGGGGGPVINGGGEARVLADAAGGHKMGISSAILSSMKVVAQATDNKGSPQGAAHSMVASSAILSKLRSIRCASCPPPLPLLPAHALPSTATGTSAAVPGAGRIAPRPASVRPFVSADRVHGDHIELTDAVPVCESLPGRTLVWGSERC